MEDVIEKHPDAKISYDADLSEKLADTDTTLDSDTVTAVNTSGVAITAVIGAVTKSGLVLTAVIQAGVHGEDYKILFKALGNVSARQATKTVEMRVRSDSIGNF